MKTNMRTIKWITAIICAVIDITICAVVFLDLTEIGIGGIHLFLAFLFYTIGSFGLWVVLYGAILSIKDNSNDYEDDYED